MKKLTHIELALENVEAVTFEAEDVEMIHLDNIKRNFLYNSYHSGGGYTLDNLHCEEFAIVIKQSGNKLENSGSMYSDWSPFKRLTYHKDIVSIYLHYDDKSYEEIYVPYEEVNGGDNLHQTSFTDPVGALHILSSTTRKAEEYFQ